MKIRKWVSHTGVLLALVGAVSIHAETLPDLKKRQGELARQVKDQEAGAAALKRQIAENRVALLAAEKTAMPEPEEPQLWIPRLKKAPVIDGLVGAEEWADAVMYPGAAGAFRMLARPGTEIYFGWAADNFYMAQRMKMRKNEKPVIWCREPKQDNVHPIETVVELYLDTKGNGSIGLPAKWQFLGNAVGNEYDIEHQYTIGQRDYDWNGDWQYAQQMSADGEYWETEMAIPRTTIYLKDPIAAGASWNIGAAASLQYPRQWSGFYGWTIAAKLVEETPEIRMDGISKSLDGKHVAFEIKIRNTTGKPFSGNVVTRVSESAKKSVVFEKAFPVALQPGETTTVNCDEPVADAKDGTDYKLTAMVLDPDGQSRYTWVRGVRFNAADNFAGGEYTPDPEPFKLTLAYMPLSNFLVVDVDTYYAKEKEHVAKAVVDLRAKGSATVIASGEITAFPYSQGQLRLDLPKDIKPGVYDVTARLLDKEGKELVAHSGSFERKDHAKEFPWIGNQIGKDDIVLKLFEPLTFQDGQILGFRKAITLDGLALPSATRAADIDLLAAPIQVRATRDGKTVVAQSATTKPEEVKSSPTTAERRGAGEVAGVKITTDYRLEYDGTARVRLTLAPALKGQSVKLDGLQLAIPFNQAAATHYMTVGANMRQSVQAGYLPGANTTGRVWDSTSVKAQNMTVGSFVPVVHLGNRASGITWFADNDQGWWPSEKTPAIEIVRTKEGPVELVLNLMSEPAELTEPRTIEFGLCVVPTRRVSEYKNSPNVFGGSQESGRWDPTLNPDSVQAHTRYYPDDIGKWKTFYDTHQHYNEFPMPYFDNINFNVYFKAEHDYFGYEWGHKAAVKVPGALACGANSDLRLYWFDRWNKEGGLNGIYIDDMFVRPFWNTWSGTAYTLPDGRIQPGYDMWGNREFVKRLRMMLETSGRDPVTICIHNTDFQFAPILTFADNALGGENPLPRGDTPDFMDLKYYQRDLLDVNWNPSLWGYHMTHLYHFDPKSFTTETGEPDPERALKVHRGAMAALLTRGVEFFEGLRGQGEGKLDGLSASVAMLKSLGGGLEFIPAWDQRGLFRLESKDPNLDIAVYRNDQAVIVIVANYGKKPTRANVWIDLPKLMKLAGPMERRRVLDLETLAQPKSGDVTGPSAPDKNYRIGDFFPNAAPLMHEPGTFSVAVQARDFRAIVFVNLPTVQGAAF